MRKAYCLVGVTSFLCVCSLFPAVEKNAVMKRVHEINTSLEFIEIECKTLLESAPHGIAQHHEVLMNGIESLRELLTAFALLKIPHNQVRYEKMLSAEWQELRDFYEKFREHHVLEQKNGYHAMTAILQEPPKNLHEELCFAVGVSQLRKDLQQEPKNSAIFFENTQGKYSFFGLYHGDNGIITRLEGGFPRHLLESLEDSDTTAKVVIECIKTIVRKYDSFLAGIKSPDSVSQAYAIRGCAALFAIYNRVEKKLIVSNMGDSRAMLLRTGTRPSIEPLSTEQGTDNVDEQKRILVAGGYVDQNGLLNGLLKICRAFGFFDIKKQLTDPSVMNEPAINIRPLLRDDSYLILANHTFWKHVNSYEAAQIVQRNGAALGSAGKAAQELVLAAMKGGKEHNVSALVVRFGDKS